MTAASVSPSVTPLRDDEPSARKPPANTEAEQRLLGAIFVHNAAFHRVAGVLRPEHFGYAVHGRIWTAISRTIGAGGEANPVTLKTRFDHDDALKSLGGAKYLAQLATAAPTISAIEDYAKEVRDLARRREVIAAVEAAADAAYSIDLDRTTDEIISRLQNRIAEIECGTTRLDPLTANQFLALDLPPRQLILDPWMPAQGIALIYSTRGIGKTLLALGIAYAVATGGGLLGWKAPAPRRVLYLDGEMPAASMQKRLAAIVNGFSDEPPAPDYLRLLSADIIKGGLPDLGTREGQAEIDAAIGEAEVLILDNISTLVRSGKENEAESWLPVQGWALAHRRAGRSILFIHHAGKGGLQPGTSRREDVLDSVIALRRPVDYVADQGARFEVVIEKGRGVHGDDARPIEASYEEREGVAFWTRTEITDVEMKRVVDALREGMSIREAAKELELHKSKVERLKRRAVEQGMLDNG
jgi:hypothetical protein